MTLEEKLKEYAEIPSNLDLENTMRERNGVPIILCVPLDEAILICKQEIVEANQRVKELEELLSKYKYDADCYFNPHYCFGYLYGEYKQQKPRFEKILGEGTHSYIIEQQVNTLLTILEGKLPNKWIDNLVDEACKKQREAIANEFGVDCPNCPNIGWYVVEIGGVDMDGENDTRDVSQVQCEFCYTEKHSKFNYLNAPSPKESE